MGFGDSEHPADEPAAASDSASDVSDGDVDPVVSDAALDVLDLTRDNPAEPWSIQFDDPHEPRSSSDRLLASLGMSG